MAIPSLIINGIFFSKKNYLPAAFDLSTFSIVSDDCLCINGSMR